MNDELPLSASFYIIAYGEFYYIMRKLPIFRGSMGNAD